MLINLLEALMIICFGISWPLNIRKSWVSRTAKGKSVGFEIVVWIGYICGIARKVLQLQTGGTFDWLFYLAFFFYIFNITEVTIDILLYVRNAALDRQAEKRAA